MDIEVIDTSLLVTVLEDGKEKTYGVVTQDILAKQFQTSRQVIQNYTITINKGGDTSLDYCYPFKVDDINGPKFILRNSKYDELVKQRERSTGKKQENHA